MPRRLLIRYWTPEDDAELEGLLRVGTSVTEIAVKLKRSRKSIQSRARTLQLAASARRAGRDVWSDEIAPLYMGSARIEKTPCLRVRTR